MTSRSSGRLANIFWPKAFFRFPEKVLVDERFQRGDDVFLRHGCAVFPTDLVYFFSAL